MRKLLMFVPALLPLYAAPAAMADMLVWKNGLRLEVRESWKTLKESGQPLPGITLLDAEGREAAVWIRSEDLDWEKTRIANEHAAVFGKTLAPTVGAPLREEPLVAAPAAPSYAAPAAAAPPPAPGVRVEDVKGKQRFGHAFVTGKVVNATNRTLHNVRVLAKLTDRKGRIFQSSEGTLEGGLRTLAPGQSASFDVMVPNVRNPYVESYEAEVLSD